MQVFSVETTVSSDGTIVVRGLPFRGGDKVSVVVQKCPDKVEKERYPLRGTLIYYSEPFAGIAEDDWEALQ